MCESEEGMAKFYAVKNGRATGIFRSWAECEQQVKGFANARYKSFTSLKDAQAYLGDDLYDSNHLNDSSDLSHLNTSNTSNNLNLLQEGVSGENAAKKIVQEKAVAYVDGSFNQSTREYGSGAVLFYQGKKIAFSKSGNDSKLVTMRNVAGEIIAATAVMKYCLSNEIPSLDIYYDYEGIRAWALGDWKANKEGTQEYSRFYKEVSKKLKVNFVKVKAHSGDELNDEADRLAKEAIGI